MSAGSSNQKSPGKKKITKADFVQAAGGAGSIDDLTKKNEKSDDPLSQLDPLWSLKSKWYDYCYFCKEDHEMWPCANDFSYSSLNILHSYVMNKEMDACKIKNKSLRF